MSTASLTAKYRPQTFGEVAGQEAVKTILSRAAAQDKVAPAYLFSGTRGVGKTTIARIFAKALNCVEAPTGEPCNKCDHCKQITAGVAVDVVEIDGASNRGIDDARRLKEDIGYAPIECRYKVFIIDEAHMLTKEAFNALLKTLEEPPPRATFILATTEPHKFPATIISRCQHYTYKMLTQNELVTHLENILDKEGIGYDAGALQIIAKRGAGSVRDSMSLLGQTLALGENHLKEEDVRNFLGLAGQDVFFQLMQSMHEQDLVGIGQLLRQVLDQGLDLGFFLRELTSCWRNMFMLRQAGKAALPLLGLSGDEADTWMEWAGKFSPVHIHACWQLTLDGQRRVMTSLEPAMALELLLLNMASLPELVDLERVGSGHAPRGGTPGGPAGPGGMNRPPQGNRQFSPPAAPAKSVQQMSSNVRQPAPQPRQEAPRPSTPDPAPAPQEPEPRQDSEAQPKPSGLPTPPNGPKSWEGLLEYAQLCNGKSEVNYHHLRQGDGELLGDRLVITCKNNFLIKQLSSTASINGLERLASLYWGKDVSIDIQAGEMKTRKSEKQLRQEAETNPAVLKVMDSFGALITSVIPREQKRQ